jgi:hypothetical protein
MNDDELQEEAAAEPVIEKPRKEPDEGTEPEGKQFIDFKALPPQVEARFRRIYGNMKQYERVAKETAKVNRALVDRLEKLENGDFQNRVDSLQVKRQEAFETGDFKKAAEYDDELLEYKLAAKERTKAGKPTVEVPEFKSDDQPLSDDHMDVLTTWARATDNAGTPLRPWASPDHKDNKRAVAYIQAAAMDPDFDIDTMDGFQAILKHVDQRMGGNGTVKQAPATATVLSGNGDGRPRGTDKIPRLTADQLKVAENMGYSAKQYAELIQKYGAK